MALSTASVYPDRTADAFEVAARLGYDGVEVMVSPDAVSQDVDVLRRLADYHRIPVLAVHAPCLLITQRVWGKDPWGKLVRAKEVAEQLGARVVVVHPPFRWQRDYARDFGTGLARMQQETDVLFAVENMFPLRARGAEVAPYAPTWNPVQMDYPHVTLDLSHTAVSGSDPLAMADELGGRLAHVHLADGTGLAYRDEHLVPGRGAQPCAPLLRQAGPGRLPGHDRAGGQDVPRADPGGPAGRPGRGARVRPDQPGQTGRRGGRPGRRQARPGGHWAGSSRARLGVTVPFMTPNTLITVAPTGAESDKAAVPALPVTLAELVDTAIHCRAAGAAVIHVHIRDDQAQPTLDLGQLKETVRALRESTDLIVQLSTGGAVTDSFADRLAVLDAAPDACSLTCGTVNFGDEVFANPYPFMRELYARTQAAGVVPEFELFDLGQVASLHRLLGELGPPHGGHVHCDLVMGVPGGMPGTVAALTAAVAALPAGATWSATGIGRTTLPVLLGALAAGGHLRVGMEDTTSFARGRPVTGNAELVERAAAAAGLAQRPPMAPSEAREFLGVSSRN